MPKRDYLEEANRVLGAAKQKSIVLRLMGAVASRIHCPRYGYIQTELGRQFTDLDFVSYSSSRPRIHTLFKELGYAFDTIKAKVFEIEFGHMGRLMFDDFANQRRAEVFFDRLEFSHDVPLQGRLEVDDPTIPLAELLLTKLQIVKLTEKDVIDMIMLLREHYLGEGDYETINYKRIAGLCGSDWGLWKTVTTNLQTIRLLLPSFTKLSSSDVEDVHDKVAGLLRHIDDEPKTIKWKARSLIGEKAHWYRQVEDLSR